MPAQRPCFNFIMKDLNELGRDNRKKEKKKSMNWKKSKKKKNG